MNEAPSAPALANRDFGPRFDHLPKSDAYICTVTAFEFIKNFEQRDPTTGETKIFDALQFYLGTLVDGKAFFIKPWPMKYSIHEKAGYTKFYKAATGNPPVAGSNPKELLGKGVTVDVTNAEKVSKKGTKYTASQAKGYSSVHAKLKSEIAPLPVLVAALDKAFADAKNKDAGDKDVPY